MTNKADITKTIEGVTTEPYIMIDADGTETKSEMYLVDSPEALKALFESQPERYLDPITATQNTQAVAEEILAELMADADDGDIYTIEELSNGRFAILLADEDGPVGYL